MQPGLWPCAFAVSFREWCGPWGHRQLFGCGQKAWCHPGWCWWSFFCSQAVRGPAVFLNSISPRFAPSYNDAVGLTKTNWWIMTFFFWCQEFRGFFDVMSLEEIISQFNKTGRKMGRLILQTISTPLKHKLNNHQQPKVSATGCKAAVRWKTCRTFEKRLRDDDMLGRITSDVFFSSKRHILLVPMTIKNVGSS